MQTPSHLLITALIDHHLPETHIPKHTTGFLIGAMLPDLAFTLLTLLYEVYYRWMTTPPINSYNSVMEYLHFDLFFNDPVWIIGHNTFHSLIVNAILLIVGYIALRDKRKWGVFLFWLSIGMSIHTIIDIFTHASDGPLIFFPLNWNYRFSSPVSYWETEYFGAIFVIIEYSINALILFYFLMRWWKKHHKNAD